MIKSFRGLLADGSQDTISLHTNNGSTGYRIKKFEVIPKSPATNKLESVVKIYTIEQSTVDAVIDFADNTLLGVGYISISDDGFNSSPLISIFDNMTFNQDIYITHSEIKNNEPCNYYIELEQIKLDLSQNTVATLKDIRNIESQ
tara:strand:- start:158 stop:592 length:435 start_codon:yes stop_codon:yes gene_type:complete